ncbi:MAG: SDR family oxidoreductase [Anaerolineales bacterium]
MKIVVIGGSGLIGKTLVHKLKKTGTQIIATSPSSGVNTLTGEGLTEALDNAHSVVDVTNSPVFDDAGVMHFFETSTRHILAAENSAGVRHHILLSVVGADRMTDSGYMRAKVAQEELVKSSRVPFSILRATQFFQFLGDIANANTVEDEVRLPAALVQPVSADDVASTLAKMALGNPTNGIIELAGPDQFGLDGVVTLVQKWMNDYLSPATTLK